MDNITEKIKCTVTETEETFIFNTIWNFIEDEYQIQVNKEDLVSAIKLKQLCDSNGYDINEILHKVMDYNQGYLDGRIDGITQVNNLLKSLSDTKKYISSTVEKILEELK